MAASTTTPAAAALLAVALPGGSTAAGSDVADGDDGGDDEVDPALSTKGTVAVRARTAGLAVAVVDGWWTVVILVVGPDEFPAVHPLSTNAAAATAEEKIRRRRVRPVGPHRDEQLIDDIRSL